MLSKLDFLGITEVKDPAFKLAILSVFSILAVYVVGFLAPAMAILWFGRFPAVAKLVNLAFLSKYSFLMVALASSFVFYRWAKKNVKSTPLFMLYAFLVLAVLIPSFDYQSVLLGFTEITVFNLIFGIFVVLYYVLIKQLEENTALTAVISILLPAALWFLFK